MKIVIAGAGLAGLAAGYWLQKAGHDVTLYEASDRSAGRAHTILRPGTADVIDVGTQYFHSNYRRALRLIDEVGLRSSLQKIRGKTRFFDDRVKGGSFTTGHRVPYIFSGSFSQNFMMNLRGLLRMARHPIDPYGLGDYGSLDEVSIGEKIDDPFVREYNVRTLVSAGALVEPDYQNLPYLHLIRLMRIIVMTDYLILSGGIASLHEALARDLSIEFEQSVVGLLHCKDRVRGAILNDGSEIEADCVILTMPAAPMSSVLPEDWEEEQSYLQSVKQPPALIVTLFLNRKMEDRVWSYVFRPSQDRLVSFCVDTSEKNPGGSKSGKTALQAWICSPKAEGLIDFADDQIREMIVNELSTSFGWLEGAIEGVHIHRVPSAIPQMQIGHNKSARAFLESIDRRKGLEVAGDHLTGGYMECALWSAERAVKSITGKTL